MIGKIINIPYQSIKKTIQREMEQHKRTISKKKSGPHSKQESDESTSSEKEYTDISKEELQLWLEEINQFESYVINDLKFILSDEANSYLIKLTDKNGHILQEFLPVQFRELYIQLKNDKDESKSGTILNVSC